MKFSAVLAAFGLVSTAWAQTAVSTFGTVTQQLEATLPVYEAAVISNAETIAGSASATAAVAAQAALNANLTAIITALESAAAQITGATVNAAGGIAGAVTGLTQADINALASDVETIVTLIEGIEATVYIIYHLGGNVQATAGAEVTALQAAIAPFAAPLEAYVAAVLTSYANAGVTVTGLEDAQADLEGIVASITGTIG